MSDTEMLDWLIAENAYLAQHAGEWSVMRHICEDEFETIGRGQDPRAAIANAMGKT